MIACSQIHYNKVHSNVFKLKVWPFWILSLNGGGSSTFSQQLNANRFFYGAAGRRRAELVRIVRIFVALDEQFVQPLRLVDRISGRLKTFVIRCSERASSSNPLYLTPDNISFDAHAEAAPSTATWQLTEDAMQAGGDSTLAWILYTWYFDPIGCTSTLRTTM